MSERTAVRLAEIQARVNAATAAPWTVEEWRNPDVYAIRFAGTSAVDLGRRPNDAAFIAHAREDVPFLLSELARVTDALREIEYYADDPVGDPAYCLAEIRKMARAALDAGDAS